jgi:16S rRNA (adenine1518-N6/adenine1519-N6)-dimethyltransferase
MNASSALDAPASREEWIELLRKLGIRPSRALGQNFLVDPTVIDRIADAAGIADADLVVEIGPGLGILTRAVAPAARRFLAIELDTELATYLRHLFAGCANVEIAEADFLRIPLEDLVAPGDDWVVVANLPYSVANPIVRRLLEAEHPPRQSTVMVQLEVAQRLVARPPDMSILSIAAQLYARSELLFRVPPGSFVPSPKVESAVVALVRREDVPVVPDDRSAFFRLVTAGFRQKRKTIANSMANELSLPKPVVEQRLTDAGIDPSLRAERLDVDDWVRLLRVWEVAES